jgi:hypothetical protein
MPQRDSVAVDELRDYDLVAKKVLEFPTPDAPNDYVPQVHPKSAVSPYFAAMLASPPLAANLQRLGAAIARQANKEGTWTHAEHEFIDQAVSYELGYLGLLGHHTPMAVTSGIPIETIEALRDGREQDLTEDERLQLRFIRDTMSGELTDESWRAMEARFGSERGTVEYVFFILFLVFHLRFLQVLGIPAITAEEHDKLIEALKAGDWKLPQYHLRPDYAGPDFDRAM